MPRLFPAIAIASPCWKRKEMIDRTSKQCWLVLVPARDGRSWVGKSAARGEVLAEKSGYPFLEEQMFKC